MLSFQHKLLQEYLAAVYIAENVKLGPTSEFLTKAFPTWEQIKNHKEVVQFACGIMGDVDASLITEYVANVINQNTHNRLDVGEEYIEVGTRLSLLKTFEREGSVHTAINPYVCEYPACGRPLAEVLANTQLAYITHIDYRDALQLSPSPTQIILYLFGVSNEDPDGVSSREFDRLWQALHSMKANIIAIDVGDIRSANVNKLSQLPQLKRLRIVSCDCSEEAGEDLVESIKAWGPEPQLTYCMVSTMPISRSVMTALCKCTHLMNLTLTFYNLSGKLSILMASPPPELKALILQYCSLHASDIHHIIQAIREGRLNHLQELDIQCNPVGEVTVGDLLEAFISTRPHTQLKHEFPLKCGFTGKDRDGQYTHLSQQFITECETRFHHAGIHSLMFL